MAWFAAAGFAPRARIELNYTEAMKSLVASSYGAAILPAEHPDQHGVKTMQIRPLDPPLPRYTGIAHRPLPQLDGASRNVLEVLQQFRQLTQD
jgi:DNA-binding transcriptional LysR family regulator